MHEPATLKIQILVIRFIIICTNVIGNVFYLIKYWNYKSEKLNPITNTVLIESATSLALKIRNRKVTSEYVTREYIKRIKSINPSINAVVDSRYENAIDEAKEADEYLRNNPHIGSDLEKEKPFFGVPMTIKESFQVTGLHQTCGIYNRKDHIATEDAACVKLLRKAGVIIMAVTNVPELCMSWDTYNSVYGQTKNPYNFSRTAGGSSGGEAANVSACGSPMGLGSDIGGSIRIPAFFNGIFGHKATTGIVDNSGQEPETRKSIDIYLSSGPLCRHACDLKPMLKIFADANVTKLSLDQKVDFKNLKVYYMEDDNGNPFTTPVDSELKRNIRKTVNYFKTTYNVPCQKLELNLFRRTSEMFLSKVICDPDQQSFSYLMSGKKGEINIALELAKCLFGRSCHTLDALFNAVSQKQSNLYRKSSMHKFALNDFKELEKYFSEMLTENVIFLFPPHPNEALYLGQPILKALNATYTLIFNLLGLPATACPVGLTTNGLPSGVQVVAGKYQDHLCLAVAEEIEKAFGGWVCPSDIQS